jgi:L-amino acid N-acyltransferase YncA
MVSDGRYPARGGPARPAARDAKRAFSIADVDAFHARAVATGLDPDTREELPVDLLTRDATEADLPAIVDIYNQSIPAGWSTADTSPITVTDRLEWFRKFDQAKRPIWVAEVDGSVVAVAYLSSFYGGRPAYDATAEVSLYIATPYQRRGIGRRFKRWVIEQCPRLGVTTLLSMHFDHNEATRRINESLGFRQQGHLTEIAVVQGQKRGLVISALRIPPTSASP